MAPSGYKLYDRFRRCNEENLYRPIIAGAIDKAEITSDADLAFVVITNSSRMIYQYILTSMGADNDGIKCFQEQGLYLEWSYCS